MIVIIIIIVSIMLCYAMTKITKTKNCLRKSSVRPDQVDYVSLAFVQLIML